MLALAGVCGFREETVVWKVGGMDMKIISGGRKQFPQNNILPFRLQKSRFYEAKVEL